MILAGALGVILSGVVFLVSGRWRSPETSPAPRGVAEVPYREVKAVPAAELHGAARPAAPAGSEPTPVGADHGRRLTALDATTKDPIPGARCYWALQDSALAAPLGEVGVTDGNGILELNPGGRTSPDGSVLVVHAQGYVPVAVDGPSRDEVTVYLEPGLTVVGRVLDSEDRPVPGATVHAFGCFGEGVLLAPHFGMLPGPGRVLDLQTAVSDEHGGFRLSGVSEFPIRLRAAKSNYVHFGPPREVGNANETVELRLQPLGRVGLRVVDARTGVAVSSYRSGVVGSLSAVFPPEKSLVHLPITGWDPRTFETWMTLRGSDKHPLPAEVRARVAAPGYEDWTAVVPVQRGAPWKPVTVKLKRASVALGTMKVSVEAKFLPRSPEWISLWIRQRLPSAEIQRWELRLDESGKGDLRLPEGDYDVNICLPSGGIPLWAGPGAEPQRAVVAPEAPSSVRFTLKGGIARIKLIDGKGQPLLAGRIAVYRNGKSFGGVSVASARLGGDSYWAYARLFPARGHDVLELPLPIGEYTFWALRPAARLNKRSDPVTIEDGSTAEVTVVANAPVGGR